MMLTGFGIYDASQHVAFYRTFSGDHSFGLWVDLRHG
eukprot:CAMPEP_0115166652 /NCGR_PEP_ID=MMETSP0227-20121206/74235_1 /TAXON_ID=89957 /ORGANISM="Polarella glacialis, Strain CCMP 1383" /LENGTH=36 /DNA_ID= /DNA_START= /DNA_END= /DNA_ORIENTATION=